jgi:hypothetical protein
VYNVLRGRERGDLMCDTRGENERIFAVTSSHSEKICIRLRAFSACGFNIIISE